MVNNSDQYFFTLTAATQAWDSMHLRQTADNIWVGL